eukprot:SAG11_NODE_2314_length_3534_cov_2.787773_4_plen_98_part_00
MRSHYSADGRILSTTLLLRATSFSPGWDEQLIIPHLLHYPQGVCRDTKGAPRRLLCGPRSDGVVYCRHTWQRLAFEELQGGPTSSADEAHLALDTKL